MTGIAASRVRGGPAQREGEPPARQRRIGSEPPEAETDRRYRHGRDQRRHRYAGKEPIRDTRIPHQYIVEERRDADRLAASPAEEMNLRDLVQPVDEEDENQRIETEPARAWPHPPIGNVRHLLRDLQPGLPFAHGFRVARRKIREIAVAADLGQNFP